MSKLKMTCVALASVAFLFLPANSQASPHGGGGGGSHGGGGGHSGSHGGGHSGGGHSGGSHYYGGHGGSHYYGGHSHYYGGYHYGHGGYYGYWGSGWGWGWGWGFGPWWWGYPYGYYGYYGYPYGGYPYGAGYYVGQGGGGGGGYAGDPRERFASIKTDVEPEEAALYLDGKLIGTADDFDGFPDNLYLGRGQYRLEFRLEGYETLTSEIDASPGQFFRIDQHMKKIPGAKHYGSYNPEHVEGEVNRYFEKSQPHYGAPNSDSNGRSPGNDTRPPSMSEDQPAMPREAVDRSESAAPEFDDERPAQAEPPVGGESDSRIIFDVSPPDAAIYMDDRFMGSARELNGLGVGVAVPPGEHRITVTCPGYRDATLRVETSAVKGGRAEIELKK
jgi:hypothetical protein